MKRISFVLLVLLLGLTPRLRAQDAATEERLNKLSGQIDNLVDGQQALKRQIDALAKELENLRADASRPKGDYASQADLKSLADALKEVDRKRMEDNDTVRKELKDLAKALRTTPTTAPHHTPDQTSNPEPPKGPESGYGYYVIKKGDTLDAIVQAYADKNIKLTIAQIQKANPNLEPTKLKVGQKVWIPAPQ